MILHTCVQTHARTHTHASHARAHAEIILIGYLRSPDVNGRLFRKQATCVHYTGSSPQAPALPPRSVITPLHSALPHTCPSTTFPNPARSPAKEPERNDNAGTGGKPSPCVLLFCTDDKSCNCGRRRGLRDVPCAGTAVGDARSASIQRVERRRAPRQ